MPLGGDGGFLPFRFGKGRRLLISYLPLGQEVSGVWKEAEKMEVSSSGARQSVNRPASESPFSPQSDSKRSSFRRRSRIVIPGGSQN